MEVAGNKPDLVGVSSLTACASRDNEGDSGDSGDDGEYAPPIMNFLDCWKAAAAPFSRDDAQIFGWNSFAVQQRLKISQCAFIPTVPIIPFQLEMVCQKDA
ncbi:MAG TPA: hypothetical protein VFO52_00930 [Longimicrobiales bacterium]|nr:hypothetical protein [Longimicrobiales bacterium]